MIAFHDHPAADSEHLARSLLSSATAGGPAFTLTINGSNFVSGSTVQWNGTARATTFVSATQLRATIAAADIAAPGTAQVSVLNPGGAASGTLPFTVTAAPPPTAPALGSLAPSSATAGGPAFTLTANGSNFVSGATVQWNGTARTTTFVSGTQLRATIAAADIAAPGTAQVSVLNPGGAASGALPFTVTAAPPPPAPALGSLAPNSATAGGPAFTLTANGSNFVSGSTVQWNGTARTTTFVSATQLRATIAAADIAAPGTAQVSVLNPGGTASGALPFTVAADPAGNLLTTQVVSSAYFQLYWAEPTVTSGITDPLGGTTAYSLATADGTRNSSGILVPGALPGGRTVTVSFWAKCTTGTLVIGFGPADGLTTIGTLHERGRSSVTPSTLALAPRVCSRSLKAPHPTRRGKSGDPVLNMALSQINR